MNLKIWFDGVQREVQNVTESTTCEQLIQAFANDASLTGLYSLVAPWRGNEINFSPSEKPLAVIKTLGENPNSFEFIIRRLSAAPAVLQFAPIAVANPTGIHYPVVPIHRPTNSNIDKAQFHNRLAYQEQELERNRIHLLNIEKEISAYEMHAQVAGGEFGSAAELEQLSNVPWSQVMHHRKSQNVQLSKDKLDLESAIQSVSSRMYEACNQVQQQEVRITAVQEKLLESFKQLLHNREKIAQWGLNKASSKKFQGNEIAGPISSLDNEKTSSSGIASSEGVMI